MPDTPAALDPHTIARILELTVAGKPMPAVGRELGISAWLISKWRRLYPSFRVAHDAAREDGIEAMVDDYQDRLPNLDPHSARVEGDFLKWLASCRNKRYRPAQALEITTVDASTAMIEARKRTSLVAQAYPAMLEQAQDTEYTELLPSPTTDNESAAPLVDPFS